MDSPYGMTLKMTSGHTKGCLSLISVPDANEIICTSQIQFAEVLCRAELFECRGHQRIQIFDSDFIQSMLIYARSKPTSFFFL